MSMHDVMCDLMENGVWFYLLLNSWSIMSHVWEWLYGDQSMLMTTLVILVLRSLSGLSFTILLRSCSRRSPNYINCFPLICGRGPLP